ncbi:MAG TPA: Uma2 family endonuclease [Tepidisphaeraceae bacterium]|jgi:Uma2 family endonuclease|nr:Uma2 family endonuclease [Tepidisphaeraceae bacterium]
MIVGTIKMTARQFLQLGEDPPGVRLELVDGEVIVSPSPDPKHSYLDRKLTFVLMQHIQDNDLGELFGDVDTIFGEYDVRRPDLIYFARNRLHLIGEKAMEGPPDLCVEIVSPSSVAIDRKQKFKQYEKGKVVHYWIVDPTAETIEGYKLTGGKYRLTGKGKNNDIVRLPPFADLEISLNQLWWRR